MSSFFKKGKPRNVVKRKLNSKKDDKKSKVKSKFPLASASNSKYEDDDEIDSDEFGGDGSDENVGKQDSRIDDMSDLEEQEAPQDKKLRLAKKYLQEIENEERQRGEENDDYDENITKRLTNDYLDSVGKLKKKFADSCIGINTDGIKIVKHKLQKLPVTCICLSSDDKYLFSGSKTSTIVKWNLEDLKSIGSFNCQTIRDKLPNSPGRSHICCLAITTDSKFLAITDMSKNIFICCPTTLKHLHTFDGHRDIVTGIAFRKDTHVLYSTSKDRSVKTWSLDEMAYVETLFGHQFSITSIDAMSSERVITSGGSDQSIRIWKIAEESQLLYRGHSGAIDCVKLVGEDNFFSCSDDGSLCTWSSMRKKPLSSVSLAHGKAKNGEANWISAITTFYNTDLVASGSCDGFIRLWKLAPHCKGIKPHLEFPVDGFVNSLLFTSDGKKIIAAIGQEHRLGRFWRMKEAKNCIMVIPLIIN